MACTIDAFYCYVFFYVDYLFSMLSFFGGPKVKLAFIMQETMFSKYDCAFMDDGLCLWGLMSCNPPSKVVSVCVCVCCKGVSTTIFGGL